ncbi:SRPBCC family protein [Taibaiella koreensis]|uniref:SRPBCC family protein n=1 Tax=Taibaiella koreensis TaxID=1268548 RepID=UPI0013C3612E|nr:SRPBCC family protein [Taibaiella koreensis]
MKRNTELNVPLAERLLSLFSGGLLLSKAFRPGKRVGILSAMGAGYLLYRGYTGHCPVYSSLEKPRVDNPVKNLNIRASMLINRPRKEVYAYWRNLENLPAFMTHLEKVVANDEWNSRWKVKVPGNLVSLEWDARIVKEEPGSLIAWESLADSSIQNAGKVTFNDAGKKATEVQVVISYIAPMGMAGNVVMQLFNRKVEQAIERDILNFKQHFENL